MLLTLPEVLINFPKKDVFRCKFFTYMKLWTQMNERRQKKSEISFEVNINLIFLRSFLFLLSKSMTQLDTVEGTSFSSSSTSKDLMKQKKTFPIIFLVDGFAWGFTMRLRPSRNLCRYRLFSFFSFTYFLSLPFHWGKKESSKKEAEERQSTGRYPR